MRFLIAEIIDFIASPIIHHPSSLIPHPSSFFFATVAAKKPHKFPKHLASKDSNRNYAGSMKNRIVRSKQSLLNSQLLKIQVENFNY
jgi:hypothetical protein